MVIFPKDVEFQRDSYDTLSRIRKLGPGEEQHRIFTQIPVCGNCFRQNLLFEGTHPGDGLDESLFLACVRRFHNDQEHEDKIEKGIQ
jgi:hypothetical protein